MHPKQLYGSGPSHISIGLDMTNVGKSSPHCGMGDTQVWSKALPTVDKTIIHKCGPRRLSSIHYEEKQLLRGQS